MDMHMDGMGTMGSMHSESSTSSMNMAMSMMTSFTTKLGLSNLWFDGWTPTTAGATVGACIGLFLLAIFSRVLAAFKTMAEAGWAQSINRQEELARLRNSSYSSAGSLSKESAPISTPSTSGKRSTPFMLVVDLPRSLIFMLQAFIGYLLMLAVMSYSAWYFIAILLGLGAGELALGRYAHSHEGTGLHM